MLSPENFQNMSDLRNDNGVKRFIDSAPVGISFIDSNGIVIYANKAELDLYGYKEEEYIGYQFHSFFESNVVAEELYQKILSHSRLQNAEVTVVCKDEKMKTVLISSHEHWNNEEFLYTMFISRDITKLKKVEKLSKFLNKASEQLTRTHDTEDALNKILEFIVPDFADWFTIDLLTEDGGLELAKMAHSDPEKMQWALKYRALNPINMNDQVEGSTPWVIRTGQVSFFPEITDDLIRAVAKSKEEADVLVNLSLRSAMSIPIINNNQTIGVVSFISTKNNQPYDEDDLAFAKDFTNHIALTLENSKLYENIRKDIKNKIAANKQKDDFLAIASHELKTPLTSVKGYIHILTNLIRKGEEVSALNILKKTERQVNKMTKLIHNFLDVSRLESSQLQVDKEEFDLNELVLETINYYNLPENKERLKFIAGKIPKVFADKLKISQVIDNYLSNALKYSPSEQTVLFKTNYTNGEVVVSVKDNGIGINDSSKDKIFQRFYRAENMNNSTASGFGIGLYLSTEIINLHKGKTWFESEEGKGSTFYFSLPVK
ncbi:MAG: hypothetical protein NVSMB45_12110 [Ginsengibacter sp.]